MSLVGNSLDYICDTLSDICKVKVDWDFSFEDEITFKFGEIEINVPEKKLDPMTLGEIINMLKDLYFELATVQREVLLKAPESEEDKK